MGWKNIINNSEEKRIITWNGRPILGWKDEAPSYPYPTDGLLARYTFDNDDLTDSFGTYDASGTGTYASGKVNNCWEGNGSSNSITSTVPAFNNGDDFSISMWINPDSVSGYHGFCRVYPSAGNFIVFETENTGLNIYYYVSGVLKANKKVYSIFSVSTWYFLCFGMKDSGTTIWADINNGSINTEGTGNTSYAGDDECTIGLSFDGKIDQVYIFNKEITSTEIAQLWNNGDGI